MRLSPRRPYLSGMDWILVSLDRMTRRETCTGMAMQVVLEFDGPLPEESVVCGFDTLPEPFPEIWAEVRRAWHLAPYWYPRRVPRGAMAPTVHHARTEADVRTILERTINQPFDSDRQHVAAHLIHVGGRSTLAVIFDHRLFDARGAEAFIRRIEENCVRPGSIPREIRVRPDHLDRWGDKFEAGRQVNAALYKLFDRAKPRVLPVRGSNGLRRFGFREIFFDERETAALLDRIEERAGLFMAMPYGLAVAFRVLHTLFERHGVAGDDYIVPVMADTRGPRQQGQEVLFNHFSFLLFRAPVSTVEDFPRLVESLKEQMYEQVKTKLTHNLAQASLLGRILPRPILSRVARAALGRGLASFCFSFLGETNQVPDRFLGVDVRRSYHMPTVPYPPGLGVFLRQARGCLNAQISYVDGVLSEAEADEVIDGIGSSLRT